METDEWQRDESKNLKSQLSSEVIERWRGSGRQKPNHSHVPASGDNRSLEKNMDTKNSWTVQWSEKQQCFHVDQLDTLLKDNLRKFIEANQFNDWALIAIVASHSEAHKICAILREKRDIPTIFERFLEEHPE